jgi:hypothetical protein
MWSILVENFLESEYLEDPTGGAGGIKYLSQMLTLQIMCPVFWNLKFGNLIQCIKLGILKMFHYRKEH